MRNTTMLKNILQLYTVTLDMDDDGTLIFQLRSKRTAHVEVFTDKSYSVVIAKAFGYMKKEMKFREQL